MDSACSTHERIEECLQIIINCERFVKELGVMMRIGFIWLRLGSAGWL
jgi:hypothetical protein